MPRDRRSGDWSKPRATGTDDIAREVSHFRGCSASEVNEFEKGGRDRTRKNGKGLPSYALSATPAVPGPGETTAIVANHGVNVNRLSHHPWSNFQSPQDQLPRV